MDILTPHQKKVVIKYLLDGVGKGLFEDCEDFWEELDPDEIEEQYPVYKEAVENFVDGLRELLLSQAERL